MAVDTATYCMVYVTTASKEEAQEIGHAIVTERLAACANVIGGMHSVYRWREAVEEAEECVLILKTRRALVEDVIARVTALHSYDVPCVVVYDISGGFPAYLAWIESSTG